VIERDLADAAIAALSADRRFATAYNAALQTATMAGAAEVFLLAVGRFAVAAQIGTAAVNTKNCFQDHAQSIHQAGQNCLR